MPYAHAGDRFEPVDLPLGRQTLPPWLLGVTVHWMRGYGNAPDVRLKVPRPLPGVSYPDNQWRARWPDADVYREELPGHYVARHTDGRVHQLYHQPLSQLRREQVDVAPAWCWISGQLPYAVYESPDGWRKLQDKLGVNAGAKPLFSKRWALVSSQSEGFAGAAYDVRVEVDGEVLDVRLRGPWHVRAPSGCVDTAGTDSCSMCVTEDLMARAVAHHAPHLRLFRVFSGAGDTRGWLQVAHGSWGCPKAWLPREHPMFAPASEVNEWSRRG